MTHQVSDTPGEQKTCANGGVGTYHVDPEEGKEDMWLQSAGSTSEANHCAHVLCVYSSMRFNRQGFITTNSICKPVSLGFYAVL